MLHYTPQHVSSSTLLIIRRTNCITTASGIVTLEIGERSYTGCHRRNGPNFGRVFLMLNYTDITQNTYIQS